MNGTLGNCSSATACYTYDAEGRRIRKNSSSGILDYVYDLAGHQVAILNSSGGLMRGEIYAGARHLGTYGAGTTYFAHSDHLGTERVRLNVSGSACEFITSLPFGDGQSTTGSCGDPSPLHFTGKERDVESGLDNFGARYIGSSMGRWISPDAINLTDARVYNPANTLNKYVYGGNNPLKYVDPDGRDITLFYYPPTFGNAGHFSLVAADPQTGRAAELNFGPDKTGNWLHDNAAKVNEVLVGNEPGDTDYGRHIQNPDQLRGMAASLTIQTNPEETEKAINEINKFNSGQPPDRNILGPNCTTVCRDLVNKIVGSKDYSTIKPSSLWQNLFPKYANTSYLQHYHGNAPQKTGIDYGNPRYGLNTFDWYFLINNRGCKTTWHNGGVEVNCP